MYKEYEVKIKMVEKQWLQLKMKQTYLMEGLTFAGRNKNLVDGEFTGGYFFRWGEEGRDEQFFGERFKSVRTPWHYKPHFPTRSGNDCIVLKEEG